MRYRLGGIDLLDSSGNTIDVLVAGVDALQVEDAHRRYSRRSRLSSTYIAPAPPSAGRAVVKART